MRKLMLMAILLYGVSCSNPEDRATGNADSTSFNSNENKVLNSRPGPTDPNSQTNGMRPDTSVSPSTSVQNSKSSTTGTNRGYRAGGGDTSKH